MSGPKRTAARAAPAAPPPVVAYLDVLVSEEGAALLAAVTKLVLVSEPSDVTGMSPENQRDLRVVELHDIASSWRSIADAAALVAGAAALRARRAGKPGKR